jgi:hypothetical protein
MHPIPGKARPSSELHCTPESLCSKWRSEMLELGSVKTAIEGLMWLCTLGKSEVKSVKKEAAELIQDLSKSLTSLWDVTTQMTNIPANKFDKELFETRWDYFFRYYLGPENISKARTHCGNVTRDMDRIT